jgi:NAD-dependent deacetylase
VIETAHRLLRQAQRIVSFSGAGLSAESGVSTFRDAGGLWAKYDPTKLASPRGFAEDPELVMNWYAERRRKLAAARPNPAHAALAARPDIVHITQNVDDLLERAGGRDIIHLHGTIGVDRCHRPCGHRETIDLADPPPLRACPRCGDRMRPDVVWFGEALPADTWQAAESACGACDVMLVIGTSAVVYPAAGLIGLARAAGSRIIVVNTEPSEASPLAEVELLGKAGEIVPELIGEPLATSH